jgi:hypothetical protein
METGAMVTVIAGTASKAGADAFGILEGIVFLSWVLLFAVMLLYLAVVTTARGRSARRRAALRALRPPRRAGRLPAGIDALRRADPNFDEQLLLDASLTATFLVFAATTTGDIAPLRRLVTESFWESPFGKITRLTARDRRRENIQSAKDDESGRVRRRLNLPIDYHPSVPELTVIDVGRKQQRVSVRIAFGQLHAVVWPGAEAMAAGAAARNFGSALKSVGQSVGTRLGSDGSVNSVSWIAAGGHYRLTFIRPSGARTDPSAALADRTCVRCGATYQSELAIACQHCQAPRALPWGNWRLDEAVPTSY